LRNLFYDTGVFKSTSLEIPILSVGNIAVGGSGKTPIVEFLIRELKNDYTIAVLSRGYGRKTDGFVWVEANLSPEKTGDEPLQIKTKYNHIAVAVCEDRVAGARRILAEKPEINLIILDDAFQHRAIKPSLQLLLSVYSKPFFYDLLLPAGRLRERRNGAQRADAIIFTKCNENYTPLSWENKTIFYSKIVYQNPTIDNIVYGFSGLADNSTFKNHLTVNYNLAGFKAYPDHYSFKQKDLDDLITLAGSATLVCTEKDWIKIKHLNGQESVKHITIFHTIEGASDFVPWLKKHLN
jgi:tetraacyldisaccharide 4'-kinase